jgi:ABC-2 type transport system ATP-binding protein
MNVIETQGLTKYYGKDTGIIDLNLKIETGEIFGFIGPNGAGKSTTIRTLLGLIFPTSGSGKIFDMDIVKQTKEIKRHVGYMPSEVNYYEKMDVHELLGYSANFYDTDCESRIKELAEAFALDLNRKIIDLSRGNQKKVSILQSLIHQPGHNNFPFFTYPERSPKNVPESRNHQGRKNHRSGRYREPQEKTAP